MEFAITLKNFLKGRRTLPIQGSFYESRGLNPFVAEEVLDSVFFLKNEESSTVLTDLKNVDNIVKRTSGSASRYYLKSGKYIYEQDWWAGSSAWTLAHEDSNANDNDPEEGVVEPHNQNYHWCSDTAVGKFDGSTPWIDSWKTGLSDVVHYMLSIRDWVLISNGQYIAGWKESDGSDWDTALLDLQPGYLSKRLLMIKAQGVRQVLIMAQYPSDRSKDGIFIWDTVADAPIDFIPVPWFHDFYIDNNIVYAIHGIRGDISQVLIETKQLKYSNSIIESPAPAGLTVYSTGKFLGKWAGLILIGASGQRNPANLGDSFSPGLWAYNPRENALFHWLTPSSNDFYYVTISAVLVDEAQHNVIVASNRDVGGTKTYYIDKLTPIRNEAGTYREIFVGPLLDAGSINEKEWKKTKIGHNKLGSSDRIDIKHRDFRRNLSSGIAIVTGVEAGGNKFSINITYGEVGDEVTIIAGTGAGQVRHIISIDTTTSPKQYVVDRDWDTVPGVNASYVEINSWKFVGYHDAANKKDHGKFTSFIDKKVLKDIHCQVKVALKHGTTTTRIKGLIVKGDLLPEE